jgi:hypothetical protein
MTAPPAEARCPACGARWSRSARYWLVTDVHGRLTLPPAGEEELTHCLVCGVAREHFASRLTPGKATVLSRHWREEKG